MLLRCGYSNGRRFHFNLYYIKCINPVQNKTLCHDQVCHSRKPLRNITVSVARWKGLGKITHEAIMHKWLEVKLEVSVISAIFCHRDITKINQTAVRGNTICQHWNTHTLYMKFSAKYN